MKAVIKCNCGQRIVNKDVTQTGFFLKTMGPSFIYIKYRCPRCRKLGEQFIEQTNWDPRVLQESISEIGPREKARFVSMGPITMDEVVNFHYRLRDLGPIDCTQLIEEEAEKL
jgi:DNA-directed RNA polymerase subunit RPC12/RpoP